MFTSKIEKIYLDVNAEKDWVTQHLIRSLPDVPVERVEDKRNLIKQPLSVADPIGRGKKNLLVTHFYGRRLKPCPGTTRHICCGYYVINAIANCPMDCSYCVLQGYLNNPYLTLYSNWEDLLQEIETFLSMRQNPFSRLGTGELSDSLALEPVFPVSRFLIPFFAGRGNGILELKTKSSAVDSLLHLDHRGRTILSWSVNPPRIINEDEKEAAPLEERINAAERCQKAGYPVGFHFDPLICYDEWEREYEETVRMIFNRIDPRRVIWVSLGGFRYPPQLKKIAESRFPRTRIFLGELFPGKDSKFRYLREIRVEMYKKMVRWLTEADPSLFIYLCMESREVWEEVFGWSPENSGHLNALFEERVEGFVG
jgi:spore photoproduct lyase